MTVSGAMPLITALPIYFVVANNFSISFRRLIYGLICAQIVCCVITAAFWSSSVGSVSMTIYAMTFSSSFIGHLQTCAVIPYFSSINPRLTSPVLTGSNLGALSTALLGLLQKPGNKQPLFSPTVFYLLCIALFVVSLCSFYYLDFRYLRNIEVIHVNQRKLSQQNAKRATKGSKIRDLVSSFSVPSFWRLIWKFAAYNASIQLVTWVFVRSVMPYAVAHTATNSDSENTETEQYAIELSFIALLSGSALSLFVPMKEWRNFVVVLAVYIGLSFIFLGVAVDIGSGLWIFYGSNVFIVALVFLMRFIDGFVSPLLFKEVARLYPERAHAMNQWISGIEKISTFIGVWLTYFLVQYHLIED